MADEGSEKRIAGGVNGAAFAAMVSQWMRVYTMSKTDDSGQIYIGFIAEKKVFTGYKYNDIITI